MTIAVPVAFINLFEINSYVFTMSVQIHVEELWNSAKSGGWRPSSAPRSEWPRMILFSTFSLIFILGSILLRESILVSLPCNSTTK